MTRPWHIAQMNVARLQAPLDSPRLADFVGALDRINALADAARGFLWRLQSESGNATDIRAGNDPDLIVNMSVWESSEALFDFVYHSMHAKVMARRREWFERPVESHQVLWWIPAGHRPTVEEGLARLAHLRRHGASEQAFTFKERHAPPGAGDSPRDMNPEPYCVGWR